MQECFDQFNGIFGGRHNAVLGKLDSDDHSLKNNPRTLLISPRTKCITVDGYSDVTQALVDHGMWEAS